MTYNANIAGYYSEIRRLLTSVKGATPGTFNDTPEGHLYESVRVMGGTPTTLNPTRTAYLKSLVGLVRTAVSGTTGTYNENEEGLVQELNRLVGGAASDNLAGWLAAAIATGFSNVAYEPEAIALFARFTTPPTDARKTLINDFWKTAGVKAVMAELDAFYILAAADSQAGRQNWVADLYNLTPVSAPTFTADRGYQGDGSAAWLSTGVNANALTKYKQDSASLVIWSRTDLPNGAATSSDAGHSTGYIGRSSANSSAAMRVNTAAGVSTPTNMNFPGFVAWTRTSSTAWAGFSGAVKRGTGVNTSAALGANTMGALRRDATAFGTNQLASVAFGQSLSDADMLTLYGALNTYLTAVGAA